MKEDSLNSTDCSGFNVKEERKESIYSARLNLQHPFDRLGMDAIISPSSSATSSSLVVPATILLEGGGGRTIDRHNPIICDSRRIGRSVTPRSSPSSPINPKSYNQKIENHEGRKDRSKNKESRELGHDEFINPPTSSSSSSSSSSSRYLLDDSGLLPDTVSGYDLVPTEKKKATEKEDFSASNLTPLSSSSSSSSPFESFPPSRPPDQVVVLRVSLHCRGCEGKVKKHISRMQGVKSFNIDFAAKKVSVIGDVTPLSVMATISKVKHAQISLPPLLDGCQ